MRKRVISALLVLVMAAIMLPVMPSAAAPVVSESYYWPVPDNPGGVTQRWGNVRNGQTHYGIDIGWNLAQQPIRATKTGTVVAVYSVNGTHWGYGNGLIIQHTDGSGYSMYAHMDSVHVSLNQQVKRGQFLGYMGSTGNSEAKHLHFELCSNVDIRGTYYDGWPYSINSNPDVLQYSYTLCDHKENGKSTYVYHNKDLVKCSLCQDVYPTPTLSGEGAYMDITLAGSDKTSAPGHFDAPYKEAPVGNRYKAGQTVYVRGSFVNARGNTWYQLASGEWLSGEYLTAHTHRWNSEGFCPYCYAYKDGKDVGYYYAVWTGPTTLKVDHAKIHFAAYGKSPRFMTYTGEITVDAKVVNGHGKEWYRIYDDRWNGGWIWQGYVETTHQKVKLSVETDIWYCPSWDHGTVGHIPANAEFTYYPDEISQYDPNWRAVRYKDTVGFVPGYILDNNLTGSRVVEPDYTPEETGESLNDTEMVGGGGSSSGSSSGGGTSSSSSWVFVQSPTDPAYLAKRVIGETTATLVANIQKPAGSNVTACGLRIFSSDGTLLKDHREAVTNVGASLTSFHAWYDIQSELGLTLTPGTDYMYQFYAVVDGVTHEGGRTGFTTNGPTPVTPPPATEEPKQEVVLYELTLDPNGAPVEKQVRKIPYTTTIGVLPVPIWEGYTFNGWYTQKEGGSRVNDYATYNATVNLTLYAHWTPKTYNLIFNANGGTCAEKSRAMVFDTIIGDMPVPTRAGYIFDGWYGKAEGGSLIHGQMRYNAPFDVTVYAHWKPVMSDVAADAWYADAVNYVVKSGLMSGYSADRFGPNDTLNRAMVVQVLFNKEGKPALNGAKHSFKDVSAGQWFNNAVTWGSKRGVVSGFGSGLFKPEDAVTIEQAAVILWNYAGNPNAAGTLKNMGSYSDWAANALRWCTAKGILSNVPFTNATEQATRAQIAQILMNFTVEKK
ncbi:MAG: InlB B-repeat-containing protein [Oscillospiraceae bacterium]|nr:InlB B-repeat-containing protein [Oscillospiraceae bacterium]